MKQTIFKDFVEPRKSAKKWLFLPMSLLLHGLVAVAVIIVPFVNAGELPEMRIHSVYMVTPPPPPTPPPAASRPKGSSKPKPNKPDKPAEPKPIPTGRIVMPIDVPTEIPEESFEDIGIPGGSEFGVPGGVEGGVDDGVIGGVIPTVGTDPSNMNIRRVGTIEKPKLIRKISPVYPTVALKARTQGTVLVEAVTDIYGRVIKVNVISGHPLLRRAASDAVYKWVYEPYVINGMPRPVVFTVSVVFRLDGLN